MKIFFSETDPDVILNKILSELKTRELGKIVNFELENDGDMVLTISKLGKSKLFFKRATLNDGLEFKLFKEKIALSHRPLKESVTSKIFKIIEKIGGKIEA